MPDSTGLIHSVGGVFLYSNDAPALAKWYEQHFNLQFHAFGEGKTFYLELVVIDSPVGVERVATVFAIHAAATPLPDGTRMNHMLNFRVHNLSATLDRLRTAGVPINKTEDADYGKFAWVDDPDGNRLELYEAI